MEKNEEMVEAKPPSNRRLMISKIVLINFKSYYGRKEIGPLHKCFSAVVGPNGSGKSNCIESLLFVFGKRAKRMRLNKLSELIHSSSAHKSDVNSCTVEVHFQDILDFEEDDDAFEVVPGTQFVVARTVDRKSVSKYMVNGEESSFKEVSTLLQGKGIDLEHNRFLILQGEVEQISLMKPIATNDGEVGLLEYLEDIIGSNKYIEKIKEMESQMSVKNDERIERTNRVKAADSELKSLESEKDIAVEYIKKERDYMLLTNLLFFIELHEGVKMYNECIEKIQVLKDQLKENKAQQSQKIQENQLLVNLIQTIHSEKEQAELKIKQNNLEFSQLEKDDVLYQNEKKQRQIEMHKLQEQIENLQKQKENIISESVQAEKQMPKIEKQSLEMKNGLNAKEQEFEKIESEVRKKTEKLRKQRDELNLEKTPLNNRFDQIKAKIENSKIEIETIEGKSSKIEDEIKINAEKIEINKSQLEIAQQEYQKHKDIFDKINYECQNAQNGMGQKKQQMAKIESELRALQDKRNYINHSKQENQNKGKVLSSLMAAQSQGKLKGVHGRLGDQGSIDCKYDTAISSACPTLDFIVVDTIKDAENCVNFLRLNNIGKASFIGLDKMINQQNLRNRPFQTPQNSKRLFDLIKSKDDKFLNAFYFAIKDTLVADDIKIGTNVAFNSVQGRTFRVVTLNGEMIEASGVMSGGGKPRQGLMSNKIVEEYSEDQVRSIAQQIDSLEKQFSSLKQENDKYEVFQAQIQQRIQSQQQQVHKYKSEFDSFNEYHNNLVHQQNSLQEILNKVNSDQNLSQKLKADIQQGVQELSNIQPKLQEMMDTLQQIESQILEVGGSNYKKKKTEIEGHRSQLQQIEKQITKFRGIMENSETNVRKIDDEISESESKISQIEKDMENLNIKCKQNEEKAKVLMENHQVFQKAKVECDQKLENSKVEFNQMKRDLQAIAEVETEIKANLDTAGVQKNKQKENCEKMKKFIKTNREKFKKSEKEYEGIIPISEDFLPDQDVPDDPEGRKAHDYTHFLNLKKITKSFNDEEIEILTRDKAAIRNQSQILKGELEAVNPNIQIIVEYREKLQDCQTKEKLLRECEQFINDTKELMQTHKQKRHDDFMEGFKFISNRVREMYQLITNGGDAELEVKDSLDPFAEGILFQVRPCKKSWKHMSKLSGGEKTLSSLSLIFALHLYKPSPLYCMDEIDAALDYKNVAIIGKYIREKAKNCQFLIISLRNNMFDLAQKMVGIYKTHDVTKTLTINPQLTLKMIQQKKEQENKPIEVKNEEIVDVL